MKQFKEFAGAEDKTDFRRTSNYIVCSVYQYSDGNYTKSYLGILSNFYLLNPNVNSYTPVIETPVVETPKVDSAAAYK